jgi:phosphoglucosamine mutase
MSKRLFGTDGIRGAAGRFPFDEETVVHLGGAVTRFLQERGRPGRIVLGYDTRQSSVPICARLVSGIRQAGGEAAVAGVLPTPGVAYLTRADNFDAGIVISTSHNPYTDNGIKVFQADGTKLPDADEAEVEALVLDEPRGHATPTHAEVLVDERLAGDYVDHLLQVVRGGIDLGGARVVLDCANGASSTVAPRIFESLGIQATLMADRPSGTNINRDCGSLHPEKTAAAVRETGADMGLAFDGDADRCLVVDDTGRVLDGDFILYLTGKDLKRRGRLRNDTVVATVMSNLWLEQRLEGAGIRMLRTPVGDKYVLEEMMRGDHALGGEQSGHVIFREHATTGDGILTGLMLLAVWKSSGERLSELVGDITPCPQVLLNVRVGSKVDLDRHDVLGPVLRDAHSSLEGRGRLLVRYSGTEPLARVMTEGNDADEIRRIAEEVAEAIRTTLA